MRKRIPMIREIRRRRKISLQNLSLRVNPKERTKKSRPKLRRSQSARTNDRSSPIIPYKLS
jgi:hypothetical protein